MRSPCPTHSPDPNPNSNCNFNRNQYPQVNPTQDLDPRIPVREIKEHPRDGTEVKSGSEKRSETRSEKLSGKQSQFRSRLARLFVFWKCGSTAFAPGARARIRVKG